MAANLSISLENLLAETDLGRLRTFISDHTLADETVLLSTLSAYAHLDAEMVAAIADQARTLVMKVHALKAQEEPIDSLMREYHLGSKEGIALMCLAEALLRVPDGATADALIKDKLSASAWQDHVGHSDITWVNLSTLGLLLSTQMLGGSRSISDDHHSDFFKRLLVCVTGPVIRGVLHKAMKHLSQRFVLASDIQSALETTRYSSDLEDGFSFDMLGEAVLTSKDAERYYQLYSAAIKAIGQTQPAQNFGVKGATNGSCRLPGVDTQRSD